MTKHSFFVFLSLLVLPLFLAGCSETFAKKSPDEFAVTRRAPLEMPPPDMTALPVPSPGAPRPQEQAAEFDARKALTGEKTVPSASSSGAAALVEQAGAEQADPRIRRKIDSESTNESDDSTPVVKKLFGWTGISKDGKGKALDAAAEAERLRKQGIAVPEKPEDAQGQTPTQVLADPDAPPAQEEGQN